MTPDELRARVAGLTVWKQGGHRAPHKPLLLLYALARFAEGAERLPFNSVEEPLVQLLNDFGPPRANHRAFSFWRLQNDGIWEIEGAENVRYNEAGDMYITDARRVNPVGRFPEAVAEVLRANPSLIAEIAYTLLDAHFPPSIHEDILTAVGLDPEALLVEPAKRRRQRDPRFREAVLRAYGYRCAVCGFETRIGSTLVGVDAAHVQWHRALGPDEVSNGLALCALHHRLFDRGAFTVEPASGERIVRVAEEAHGGEGFERWLRAFHERPIAEPVNTGYRVAEPFTAWHRREVFRGPARS